MNDVVIDSERLQALLKDFQLLTEMRISFWRPDGQKILSSSSDDNSQFCTALRQNPALMQACKNCDSEALTIARKTKMMHTFVCHAGLEETVYPIVYDDRPLGYLMIGQARSEDISPSMLQSYWQHLDRHGLNLEEMRDLYMGLPFITKEKRAAAIQMLRALTQYVYLENMVSATDAPLVRRIDDYVTAHIGNPLSLSSLSRKLQASKAEIRHTLRCEHSTSFRDFVRAARVRQMQKLLNSGFSGAQAAKTAGFILPVYGMLVFKKHTGAFPGAYCRDMRKEP